MYRFKSMAPKPVIKVKKYRDVHMHLATDKSLSPEQKIIIAVFKQARLDIFSSSKYIRQHAEMFLKEQGYNIEQIRASWTK